MPQRSPADDRDGQVREHAATRRTRGAALEWLGNWPVVRTVAAVLLTVAAALKLADLPWARLEGGGASFLHWGQVLFEVALASWLLSGLFPLACWRIATATFVLFGALGIFHGLRGEASCGCFGPVEVNPWITALIDASLVAGFVVCNREVRRIAARQGPNRSVPHLAVAGIVFGTLVAAAGARYLSLPGPLKGGQHVGELGSTVLLQPEVWVGSPFPLTASIDAGSQLQQGRWRVALVHHDCAECQALIRRYSAGVAGSERLAVVQVPPYGPLEMTTDHVLEARLADDRQWFVAAPVEITLDDGLVASVRNRRSWHLGE